MKRSKLLAQAAVAAVLCLTLASPAYAQAAQPDASSAAAQSTPYAVTPQAQSSSVTEMKAALQFQQDKDAFVARTKQLLKKYKAQMTSKQRKTMKSLIASAPLAKDATELKKLTNKRTVIVWRAQLSKYLDGTENWGKAHLKYVKTWGKRNNAFLKGTPMAKTGYLIAQAAYKYDMDPRLCSAIAWVESRCGVAPYKNQYNVWGWVYQPPEMTSWQDAIEKWNSCFQDKFGGKRYPLKSMYGYCGYKPSVVNKVMEKI